MVPVRTEMESTMLLSKKSMKSGDMPARVAQACDYMESLYAKGQYPGISVARSWSRHNPVIRGELARPDAIRWFLVREMEKLLEKGADIEIFPSRERIGQGDPELLDAVDEEEWDIRKKKLFLFTPERIELSMERIEHYTGCDASAFQRYLVFTNYDMHIEMFLKKYPSCLGPCREGVQMPAYHAPIEGNLGVSIVNIGVGPSNAKTITDHLAVLRPDAMIMMGHCGGLRNHQEIGDFVLASGYMRDDLVLDETIPLNVPIIPNFIMNFLLRDEITRRGLPFRQGTVFTTGNRNWEFAKKRYVRLFSLSRSIAIDMESATIATNGFRYRIPHVSLLAVSDKPLHGKPKAAAAAREFYERSKENHLDIVLGAIDLSRGSFPRGFPNDAVRGTDEPLLGGA